MDKQMMLLEFTKEDRSATAEAFEYDGKKGASNRSRELALKPARTFEEIAEEIKRHRGEDKA